jgi:hypothetical protein
MVIKASASTEIRTLVDALAADDDVHREAAIARLGIIGARAVDRLTDAYAHTTSRPTRLAILRALEGIGDRRSAPLARQALGEGGDVAIAATGILRALLSSTNSTVAAAALDTLVATTLDRHHERRLRLAAFDALQELPDDVRTRVAAALHGDPGGGLNDVAGVITTAESDAARRRDHDALWKDALDGRLPDAPDELRAVVATRAATAPLNTLRSLVDAVRAPERDAARDGARRGWTALRGSLHQALAFRGSRVALYDLREAIEDAATPLPTSFLTALHVLGDASCLEPLAAAWGAAEPDRSIEGLRWRQQLASALRAIAQREKITKRHAVRKKIAARWPAIFT